MKRNTKQKIYRMKLALEKYGWEWNVLDMMDDQEIQDKYEEMKRGTY